MATHKRIGVVLEAVVPLAKGAERQLGMTEEAGRLTGTNGDRG